MLKYLTLTLFLAMTTMAHADSIDSIPKNAAKITFSADMVVSKPVGPTPDSFTGNENRGPFVIDRTFSGQQLISFGLRGKGHKHLHGLCQVYSDSVSGLVVNEGSVWVFSEKYFFNIDLERSLNLPSDPASMIVWKLTSENSAGSESIYLSCQKQESFKAWPDLFDLQGAASKKSLPLELSYIY